jgi:hypothetical protein
LLGDDARIFKCRRVTRRVTPEHRLPWMAHPRHHTFHLTLEPRPIERWGESQCATCIVGASPTPAGPLSTDRVACGSAAGRSSRGGGQRTAYADDAGPDGEPSVIIAAWLNRSMR